MKQAIYIAGAITMLSLSGASQASPELTGYAVLTSDYVWRGVTQSDGHAAVQLAGDLAFDSGIYAGIWASTVDIENVTGTSRDAEVNYYAGYTHELGEDWNVGAAIVAYTYPGQEGAFDYDYEELLLSLNYRDRVWLEYAYSPDLYDTGFHTDTIEIYTEWPVGKHLLLGAGAGYYDHSDWFDDGYGYWQLGITWPIGRFDIDLRYHDTNGWVPIVSSPDRDGARGSLSVRLTF